MRYFLLSAIFLLGMGALLPLPMADGCSRCKKQHHHHHEHKPKKHCPPKIEIPPIKPPKIIPPIRVPPTLSCPIPNIHLNGCINLLGGIVSVNIGVGALQQCCPLFGGLDPVIASHCLCSCYKNRYSNPAPFLPTMRGLLGGCGFPAVDLPCI